MAILTGQPIPGHEGQTMNVCQGETSWRLVHDGVQAIALFHSSGVTKTKKTIFGAGSRAECVAHGQGLGLEWGAIEVE